MSSQNDLQLFYSKKCPKSVKLLREYNLNGFKLINVDNQQNIPPQITVVPCLMNSHGQILFGKQLFDTIEKNHNVEPFQFSHSNNMNTGFSFIDSDNEYYAESEGFISF